MNLLASVPGVSVAGAPSGRIAFTISPPYGAPQSVFFVSRDELAAFMQELNGNYVRLIREENLAAKG